MSPIVVAVWGSVTKRKGDTKIVLVKTILNRKIYLHFPEVLNLDHESLHANSPIDDLLLDVPASGLVVRIVWHNCKKATMKNELKSNRLQLKDGYNDKYLIKYLVSSSSARDTCPRTSRSASSALSASSNSLRFFNNRFSLRSLCGFEREHKH